MSAHGSAAPPLSAQCGACDAIASRCRCWTNLEPVATVVRRHPPPGTWLEALDAKAWRWVVERARDHVRVASENEMIALNMQGHKSGDISFVYLFVMIIPRDKHEQYAIDHRVNHGWPQRLCANVVLGIEPDINPKLQGVEVAWTWPCVQRYQAKKGRP